ncbi:unnamed protein product [Phaeothamnion confervicola]
MNHAALKMASAQPPKTLVVGSTGRLGQRIVRELLISGATVRAAVRPASQAKAEELFADDIASKKPLELCLTDLDDENSIAKAVGGCGAVVCALGALENELFNWKAPRLVDGEMSQRVIRVSRETGSVKHFLLVTSLGTGRFGLPASLLNLFWGVLKWKRAAEVALIESGLPYTILRPGGMERPSDDYEETHNVRLASADSLFGGQVSRLQIAKLAAAAVWRPEAAVGKIAEVVAEQEAPLVPYPELLEGLRAGKTEEVWKKELGPLQFYVLRMGGTEPAFTSALNGEKRLGIFNCGGCGQPLFASEAKYNSGTGWPSFWAPIADDAVSTVTDFKLFVPRNEIRCSSCGGHLGHVFPDGPRPTGQRYCMNGAALEFEPVSSSEG